ncbi:MAG: SOS response-associated peptidase [Holophagaceae bacterium]
MCGRYTLDASTETLAKAFGVAPIGFRVERHWNIAPGQYVIVVRPNKGGRLADQARWGLVPAWAKDPSSGPRPINARAETVATKPTFRDAFRHSRCLVPASGFYEWKADGGRKHPWYIHPRDGGLLAFAGLTAVWEGPEGPMRTVCIVTTTPNELMAPIHDRMPVILPGEAWTPWLDETTPGEVLKSMLVPVSSNHLTAHRVGHAVGRVQYDGPELIAPDPSAE